MNVEERSTDSQPLNPSPGQTTDTPQNTGSPASQDGLSAGMEGAAQDATTLPGQNAASIQAAGAVEPGTSVTQPTDGVQEAPPVRRRRLRPHLRPVHIHVRVHTFDSFHFRNYRLLWASTVSSSGGFWLQQVIIGWLTYSLTQSALLTSLALSLDWLLTLAAPLGGLLADRWDRGKLLVLSFAYQAAITLGLSLVVLLDLLETWHIFGFIMLMGLSWVLNDPARTSLIPNIVPRKNLVNAFALNSLGFSATRLAVPAAGGILLAVVGAGPALLLQAAMQLVAVVMALGLRVAPSSRPKPQLASGPSALLEAIRYIKGDPTLLSFLLIGTIPWVVVSPFVVVLMPVYAAEVFDVGPTGLGLLLTAVGAGATVGTFTLASLGDFRRKGLMVLVSIVLAGVAMVLFSQSPSYGLAFPSLIVLSGGMMALSTISSAVIQGSVSDELRGRVSGLYMGAMGLFPAGSLLAGGLAERFGAPSATLIGTGILAAAFIALTLRFRGIWRVQ